MILSNKIKSNEALHHTLAAEAKRVYSGDLDDSPIRILVAQDQFKRANVAWAAHNVEKETGVELFTSWVKVDGKTYWVIQEEVRREKTGA